MKIKESKAFLSYRWAPASVCLLAFVLRLIHLPGRPLWYDEAFSVQYAALSADRMIYGTVTPVQGGGAAEVHPLLYYFLLHGWMRLAGLSPLAVRFLSVMLGMITVVILWQLADWWFDRRAGLTVGLLAATNPFHVAYSQETRMYALLGLGAVTATSGLLRALDRPETRSVLTPARGSAEVNRSGSRALSPQWWLFILGSAITLYAHNVGAFVLVALHLLVAATPRWRRHLPKLALADLAVLILFSPWLIKVLPGQIGIVRSGYWLSTPGLDEVIRATMLPVLTFYEPAPGWLLGLGLFTSLLLLIVLALQASRSRSRARWFLILTWMPVLLAFLISRWQPVYLERALLPSALFYLVAAGWLLSRQSLAPFIRISLGILLMLSTIGSLTIHYLHDEFPRPPFREAVSYLEEHVAPGDAVVHTNKLTYLPMHTYSSDLPGAFLADPPGSPQDTLSDPTQEAFGIFATPTITAAVGDADRAWVVYFPREVREARAICGDHAAFRWLDNRFLRAQDQQFSDLMITLYRRRAD